MSTQYRFTGTHIYVLLAVVRNAAKVSQPFIDDFGASGFDDTHDTLFEIFPLCPLYSAELN